MLAFICTIEELSIEKLNPNHSKDKLKENVNDEDVEDIFEGDDDAVKNSFQLWNAIDCLQSSKHTQKFHFVFILMYIFQWQYDIIKTNFMEPLSISYVYCNTLERRKCWF